MAHKLKNAPSLNLVFLIVAVVLVGGSIIVQSFKAATPPVEMSAEQKPLPKQTLNQGGSKSTVLTFVPNSSVTEPLTKTVGEEVSLQMVIDPGQNLVSFVKLDITYDPAKLAPVKQNAFQPQGVLASSILDGPVYSKGKISVTMSIGADPTKALSRPETSAIVTFRTLAATSEGTPTLVSIGPDTNILSLAAEDSASENVLSTSNPAAISITR